MIEPSKLAKFDQALEELIQTWPSMLWRFNEGLKEQGFNQNEALLLTMEYMKQLMGQGKDRS